MHLIGCNLLQSNAKMEVKASQASLTSHQMFNAVYMLKNDADIMSEVSAFRSPKAASSNLRSPPVTGTGSDHKKAKRQASGKKGTDTKKVKKQASETAGHSMSLPNGEDDHDELDDMEYLKEEGQHQPAQHQYGTRAAAAAIMTPAQANKDQGEAGLAPQAARPAKAGKTAVGADAAAAADRAVGADAVPGTEQVMHMDFSNVPPGPYGIDPRTKKPYLATYFARHGAEPHASKMTGNHSQQGDRSGGQGRQSDEQGRQPGEQGHQPSNRHQQDNLAGEQEQQHGAPFGNYQQQPDNYQQYQQPGHSQQPGNYQQQPDNYQQYQQPGHSQQPGNYQQSKQPGNYQQPGHSQQPGNYQQYQQSGNSQQPGNYQQPEGYQQQPYQQQPYQQQPYQQQPFGNQHQQPPFGSQQQQQPPPFHLNSSNPQFVQQVGTLQQTEVRALQQQVQALYQQLHSPQQQQRGPNNMYDAEAEELATELRTEIRIKREYAELERQRNLEDKMIKMTELHKRARH
jgi:hypothetical protein